MTVWLEASLELEASQREAAEAAAERVGACAITLEDAGDRPILEPAPGETPLWPNIRLSALFEGDSDRARILLALMANVPGLSAQQVLFRTIGDRDWTRAWMDRFRPMRFGRRLWIVPSHVEPPAGAIVTVRLDPGLAFGTGTHPTTAMCLEALDGLRLGQCDVLDFGCGSGVLAIAALALGASTATGIDNDPQALAASEDNAGRNGVLDRLVLSSAAEFRVGRYDVVVANILAQPLVDLAPRLLACLKPGGRLLLSGILVDQVDTVVDAYGAGCGEIARIERDGWVLLSAERA